MPNLQGVNLPKLQKFRLEIEASIRTLETYGEDLNSDRTFVSMIFKKLPKEVAVHIKEKHKSEEKFEEKFRQLEQKVEELNQSRNGAGDADDARSIRSSGSISSSTLTLHEILDYLKEFICIREEAERSSGKSKEPPEKNTGNINSANRENLNNNRRLGSSLAAAVSDPSEPHRGFPCVFCAEMHYNDRCVNYKTKEQRLAWLGTIFGPNQFCKHREKRVVKVES
jgi:hypothetical protein